MIVLQPVSHPQLAPIQIDETLFAVGRAEAPFDAYPPEIVADLSRRHARIFCESGSVYLADLDSKNGTTVNGVAVRQAITRLGNGDQIGFGPLLRYRVQFQESTQQPAPAARLVSLTLSPQDATLDLQPIVISRFPFLIGKTDDAFARYKDKYPHQVNYLSRRHAHIFLKGGLPFVEDLGSTNRSFVGGERLEERAVALHEGEELAFGGHHFAYRVSMQWERAIPDPTVTHLGLAPAPAPAAAPDDADKTTFVAAADSFLDIFCVDQAPAAQADPVPAAHQPDTGGTPAGFLSQLMAALGAGGATLPRVLGWGAGALALAGVLAWLLFRLDAPERNAQHLLDSGDYARAAAVAAEALARDPGDARLKALGVEALLKAKVPSWAMLINTRQFDSAAALVADMKRLGRHNPELQPLLTELDWIGKLERFVNARGGADAAGGNAADAATIARMLKQWEDDSQAHQRAFSTISSFVPGFRDTYAEALSHLRKLALSGGRADHEQTPPPPSLD